MRALLDFTKLDVEWQQNGVATTRDYIKKKPDTVRRFVRAYVEGSHYNLTNPKGAQKILQKYLAIKKMPPSSREQLKVQWQQYQQSLVAKPDTKGEITPASNPQ